MGKISLHTNLQKTGVVSLWPSIQCELIVLLTVFSTELQTIFLTGA